MKDIREREGWEGGRKSEGGEGERGRERSFIFILQEKFFLFLSFTQRELIHSLSQ